MIEEFYRATDNNGTCWDFSHEPKWVEDHWRPANHEYREYTGPNKPSPGKCEKRFSVPAVHGLSDIATLEYQFQQKDSEIMDLRVSLNNARTRVADLESEKRGENSRLASLKVRLDKAQALVSGLESQVKQLKQLRESDTRDFLEQSQKLNEAENRVAELEARNKDMGREIDALSHSLKASRDRNVQLEKQSKVMPEPVEEVYLRIKSTCLSTSKLGQLATEIGKHYNPFKIEKTGVYEAECGRKVYVFMEECGSWHCYVVGCGHQIITESGSCMGGKVQLARRIGDL